MLTLPLEKIDKETLEALATNQTHEGRTLEYKRDLNLDSDGDKKELAKDVSSFANAAGGFIVYGAQEAKDETGKRGLGYPQKIVGIDCKNWDELQQRIESVVRDRLDPRVPGFRLHKVDGFERGPAIVAHIPRSWLAPHMAAAPGQTHFYSRNSSGVHPLDVREIAQAFRVGVERAEQLRRFRDARLGVVLAGETPVPLRSGGTTLVIHACPLDEYDAGGAPGFGDPGAMPPLQASGWSARFNLDGFLTYAGPADGPQRTYSQAFRNGSFEAVAPGFDRDPKGRISGGRVEKYILTGVALFAKLSRERGYDGPLSVMVALTGAKGARVIKSEQSEWANDNPDDAIDRSTLILPDVLLEGPTPAVSRALKPVLDALWQSSGWSSSPFYDATSGQRTQDAPEGR